MMNRWNKVVGAWRIFGVVWCALICWMTSVHAQTAEPLTPLQKEYVALADRYQIVRLQHKLAEEEAAVAEAKAKLRGASPVPHAQSVWPNPAGASGVGAMRLLYVDHQAGHWSAVLRLGHRTLQVHPEMTLPNGAHVLKVNATGVLLSQSGQSSWLRFR